MAGRKSGIKVPDLLPVQSLHGYGSPCEVCRSKTKTAVHLEYKQDNYGIAPIARNDHATSHLCGSWKESFGLRGITKRKQTTLNR